MTGFPIILLHVLESEQYPHAIGWGADGNSVWIRCKEFQQEAMQVHFPGIKKFTSFTRKMNRYGFTGFKRIIQKDCVRDEIFNYHHPVFRRGISPHVASMIRIQHRGLAANTISELTQSSEVRSVTPPTTIPPVHAQKGIIYDVCAAGARSGIQFPDYSITCNTKTALTSIPSVAHHFFAGNGFTQTLGMQPVNFAQKNTGGRDSNRLLLTSPTQRLSGPTPLQPNKQWPMLNSPVHISRNPATPLMAIERNSTEPLTAIQQNLLLSTLINDRARTLAALLSLGK